MYLNKHSNIHKMTILQDIYRIHCPKIGNDVFIQFAVNNLHKLLNRKDRWTLYNSYRCNKFICTDTLRNITILYGKYVRFIMNVSTFMTRFRKKRAHVYNNEDLLGIPLDKKNDDVLSIYENKTFYLFSKRDLINIFYFSLTYIVEGTMITSPNHPRNPHTNMQFSQSALYTIQNFLFNRRTGNGNRNGNSIPPRVILSYFYNNYNLELVYQENKYILDRNATKDYLSCEVSKKRKCIKLLELIYLFTGYRMNENSIRRFFQLKTDNFRVDERLNDQHGRVTILGKRGFDLDITFQNEILRKGKQVLLEFYYCVFFEQVINRYKFNLLKMKIIKYIPLDEYFQETKFSLKLRQKQIISKRYMDYSAAYFVNPFSRASGRRRQLARVRNAIRYEMNWSHNDISMNNIDDGILDEKSSSDSESDDL